MNYNGDCCMYCISHEKMICKIKNEKTLNTEWCEAFDENGWGKHLTEREKRRENSDD